MVKLTGDIRRDFEKVSAENVQMKDRILGYQEEIRELRRSIKKARESKEKQKADYEMRLAEKDAAIKALENRLAHELALKAHDGTNTGIPTSQTPIGKKKAVPNSRVSSGKKRGGQPGHERHILEPPPDDEIDAVVVHGLEDGGRCPGCGGRNRTYTGEHEDKYEIDVKVKVMKTRHEFFVYECSDCGEPYRTEIPPNLRAGCQYGPGTQAVALSLMNTANTPINKVRTFLSGLTFGEVSPCEGYIAKLQWRGASALDAFMDGLRLVLITRPFVYWDETVIMIATMRGCLRFYGDERIAFYAAHPHKGAAGIDGDNVLTLLTPGTRVMHDHNKHNYNAKYSFQNLECNQHLQRDLQRNSCDTMHLWSTEFKDLIASTIHDRKEAIARDEPAFPPWYVSGFRDRVAAALAAGWGEYEAKPGYKEAANFERLLLIRIDKYGDNYFKWVEDFGLPTTNNLSERALRCVKSRMKISGQFQSAETAGHFARIKSYIETCRRNGINEIHALSRLCEGNPYTVKEIFSSVHP